MRKVLFIYNPLSGEAQIAGLLDRIVLLYQKAGFTMSLFRITRERGLKELAAIIADLNPEHLLVAGGDGTINRLVNYLKHRDIEIPLGLIPSGTANDFANLIGMPGNPIEACRRVLAGSVQRLDLGRVGNRYFVNVLSSGLFTEVSHKTPTTLKNTFGRLAYYMSSLGELPMFRRINIEVQSEELSFRGSCLILLVFNGRTAGNLRLANQSSARDGVLDVLIIRGENIVESIKTVFHFLVKRDANYPEDVVYFQTNKLRIESRDPALSSDLDGELGGVFPLDIECLPGALQLIF